MGLEYNRAQHVHGSIIWDSRWSEIVNSQRKKWFVGLSLFGVCVSKIKHNQPPTPSVRDDYNLPGKQHLKSEL